MTKTITLAHGNGGAENNELISKVFYNAFKNDFQVFMFYKRISNKIFYKQVLSF